MKTFSVVEIAEVIAILREFEARFDVLRKPNDMILTEGLRNAFGPEMTKALASAQTVQCIDCKVFVERAAWFLAHGDGVTIGMASVELRHAREGIMKELSRWQFAAISPKLVDYAEAKELFGSDVHHRFEKAREDIRQAGNCIAVESPTAAVFHLMRVAEYGLRSLAKQLRVKLTHSGKKHPIEFADWEKVITGCKNKIDAARKLGPGPKRQARLERYSNAADHCLYMKEIWRNNVSHARDQYNPGEAIGALERVRDFMCFLAGQ